MSRLARRAGDAWGGGRLRLAVDEGPAPREVTGFGRERVEDLAAYLGERETQQMQMAIERSRKGVDMHGKALDRSRVVGGWWWWWWGGWRLRRWRHVMVSSP